MSLAPTLSRLPAPRLPGLPLLLSLGRWLFTLGVAMVVFGVSAAAIADVVGSHASSASMALRASTPAVIEKAQPKVIVRAPASAKAPVPATPTASMSAPAPVDSAATATHGPAKMLATSDVALHAQAGQGSPRVGAVPRGQVVTATSKTGGWILVTTASGATGWAWAGYLHPADPGIATDSPFWTGAQGDD